MSKQDLMEIDNDIINKIIANDLDVYFQYTYNSDKSFSCDYLSESARDLYYQYADDVIANPHLLLHDLIHAHDLDNFKTSLFEAIKSQTKWNIDYRLTIPKKGIVWIQLRASVEKNVDNSISIFGKKTNITKSKEKEIEQQSSEDRNQFANMAAGAGVWDWNLVTNKVFYSNESLQILEIDPDDNEIIDNPESWDDRVHIDDRDAYFGNIKLHFEEKIPYYETYHRLLCNGKYKWILDRGKVVSRDKNGNPTRIVGTHNDVSLQKENEQNLLENLELVNNQKNKLLNFAHIVSHNLRTHTGNFSSLLDMNANRILDNSETFEHLRTVSDELTKTLENLIDLVEVQSNEDKIIATLNIAEYIQQTLTILTDDIQRQRITIKNDIPNDLTINFTPAYLESIILNLTTNAIKYSHPDVPLIISYSFSKTDDYIILEIADNGLGIDLKKHKKDIFGMYKTFHKNDDSTGIGLYITKNQIESLQGKIEVESTVNVGSTFKVYFKI